MIIGIFQRCSGFLKLRCQPHCLGSSHEPRSRKSLVWPRAVALCISSFWQPPQCPWQSMSMHMSTFSVTRKIPENQGCSRFSIGIFSFWENVHLNCSIPCIGWFSDQRTFMTWEKNLGVRFYMQTKITIMKHIPKHF